MAPASPLTPSIFWIGCLLLHVQCAGWVLLARRDDKVCMHASISLISPATSYTRAHVYPNRPSGFWIGYLLLHLETGRGALLNVRT